MKKWYSYIFAAFALAALMMQAETRIDIRSQAKNVDFSEAVATKPFKMGAELPATCSPGEAFFRTGVADGHNLYGCAGAGWSPLGGGAAMNLGSGIALLKAGGGGTFEFKTLRSGSNLLTILSTGDDSHVDFTISERNFDLSNIGGLVRVGQISATGTPGPATFLRGDGQWSAPVIPHADGTLTCEGVPCRVTPGIFGGLTAPNLWLGANDFSAASMTKPFKTGSTPPANCTVGEVFYDIDAAPGQNIYGCTATDTWTPQSGGGGVPIARTIVAGTGLVGGGDLSADRTLSIAPGMFGALAGSNQWGGANDFSTASMTKPFKAGTTPPVNCTVGEMFYDTDATAGQNILGCTAADIWTPQSGSTAVNSVFGRTGAVTAQTGDYNSSQVTVTPAGGIAATNTQAAIEELDSEKVSATRVVSAGAGLTGGGDLSADRTLSLTPITGAPIPPNSYITAANTAVFGQANRIHIWPQYIPGRATFSKISFQINAGGSDGTFLKFAILSADRSTILAETTALDYATGLRVASLSGTITAGPLIWVAVTSDGTTKRAFYAGDSNGMFPSFQNASTTKYIGYCGTGSTGSGASLSFSTMNCSTITEVGGVSGMVWAVALLP